MRALTASKVSLAAKCLAFLRDDFVPWDTTTSPSARLGKAVHSYAEDYARGKGMRSFEEYGARFELRPAQLRDFRLMAAAWLNWASSRVLPSLAKPELKIDYDPIGRKAVLREPEGKCPPGWITSVVDLVQPEQDGSIWLTDYKTGHWVPPADDSFQLGTCAVAYAALEPVETIHASFTRVGKNEVYEVPRATLSRFRLDVFADRLEEIATDAANDEKHEATPTPGPWCAQEFCPCRKECPAFAAWSTSSEPAEVA